MQAPKSLFQLQQSCKWGLLPQRWVSYGIRGDQEYYTMTLYTARNTRCQEWYPNILKRFQYSKALFLSADYHEILSLELYRDVAVYWRSWGVFLNIILRSLQSSKLTPQGVWMDKIDFVSIRWENTSNDVFIILMSWMLCSSLKNLVAVFSLLSNGIYLCFQICCHSGSAMRTKVSMRTMILNSSCGGFGLCWLG